MSDDQSTLPPEKPGLQPRPPRKSLTASAVLLPIVLLGTVLWLNGRNRIDETPDAQFNGVQSTSPAPNTVPRDSSPSPQAPLKLTLFVPNDNAELEKQEVTVPDLKMGEMPTPPEKYFQVAATRAVELLLEKSPNSFPKGTKLKSLSLKEKIAEVNLSREFAEESFWQKGDSYAILATDAITNTVTNLDNDVKVRFLVEGKPVEILGQLDLSEPLSQNPTTVAKP